MADATSQQIQQKVNELYRSLDMMGSVPQDLRKTLHSILGVTVNYETEYEKALKERISFEDDITKKRREVLMDMRKKEEQIREMYGKTGTGIAESKEKIEKQNKEIEKAVASLKELNNKITQSAGDKERAEAEKEKALIDLNAAREALVASKRAVADGNIAQSAADAEQARIMQEIALGQQHYDALSSRAEMLGESLVDMSIKAESMSQSINGHRSALARASKEVEKQEDVFSALRSGLSQMMEERDRAEKVLLSKSNVLFENLKTSSAQLAKQVLGATTVVTAANAILDATRAEMSSGISQSLSDMVRTSYYLGTGAKEYAEMSKANRDVVMAMGGTRKHIDGMTEAASAYSKSIGDITERAKFVADSLQMLGAAGIRPSATALADLEPSFRKIAKQTQLTYEEAAATMSEFIDMDHNRYLLAAATNEKERSQILKNIQARFLEQRATMGSTKSAIEATKALTKIAGLKPSDRHVLAATIQQTMGALGIKGNIFGLIASGRKLEGEELQSVNDALMAIKEAEAKAFASGNVAQQQAYASLIENISAVGLDLRTWNPAEAMGKGTPGDQASIIADQMGEVNQGLATVATTTQSLGSVFKSEIGQSTIAIVAAVLSLHRLGFIGKSAAQLSTGPIIPPGGGAGKGAMATMGRAAPWVAGAVALGGAAYGGYQLLQMDNTPAATEAEQRALNADKKAKAVEIGEGVGFGTGGLAGAALGAKLGILGGPIGVALGSLAGGIIGSVGGEILGGLAGSGLGNLMFDKKATVAPTLNDAEAQLGDMLKKTENMSKVLDQKIQSANNAKELLGGTLGSSKADRPAVDKSKPEEQVITVEQENKAKTVAEQLEQMRTSNNLLQGINEKLAEQAAFQQKQLEAQRLKESELAQARRVGERLAKIESTVLPQPAV